MARAKRLEVAGRGSALPRLAQVLYELFGNVDLVLSDIMVAIVLTAAAQQNRRRAYIETKFGIRFTEDEEAEGGLCLPCLVLLCYAMLRVVRGVFLKARVLSWKSHGAQHSKWWEVVKRIDEGTLQNVLYVDSRMVCVS